MANSEKTDSTNTAERYTKFEKNCIKITALIATVFFVFLSIEIFNLKPTSYQFRNRFSYPDLYFTIVIFICMIILLYFLAKGFWIGSKHNLNNNLLFFIPVFTALIIYILLYWPELYTPYLTRTGWNIIHLFGLILLYFIILLTNQKPKIKNIVHPQKDIIERPEDRFSQRDIKFLYTLVLLCVIGFFSFVIIDIFGTFSILNYSYIYSDRSLTNPYYVALLVCYFFIICLSFLTLKGVFIGLKNKMSIRFIFKLPFIIAVLIVYYPTVLTHLKPIYWILIDTASLGFFLCYLIYIPTND
ncbi:MAG: hypothetical protein GY756_04120 [bacterium]|nr:hypothetical protein [bacterium]